jgi:hypothetical protein
MLFGIILHLFHSFHAPACMNRASGKSLTKIALSRNHTITCGAKRITMTPDDGRDAQELLYTKCSRAESETVGMMGIIEPPLSSCSLLSAMGMSANLLPVRRASPATAFTAAGQPLNHASGQRERVCAAESSWWGRWRCFANAMYRLMAYARPNAIEGSRNTAFVRSLYSIVAG